MNEETAQRLIKRCNYLEKQFEAECNKTDDRFDYGKCKQTSGELKGFRDCLEILGYGVVNDKLIKLGK